MLVCTANKSSAYVCVKVNLLPSRAMCSAAHKNSTETLVDPKAEFFCFLQLCGKLQPEIQNETIME